MPPGFPRPRRHSDLPRHSGQVRDEVQQVRMRHLARPQVLGVDPKLILVVNLGGPVADDEFRRAGLRVLNSADKSVVIAFADDPQMVGFFERLDACAAGVPRGRESEPYAAFVDAIDSVRDLGPSDRISTELADVIGREEPASELRLDVELWHPDDRSLADQWTDMLRTAVDAVGGRVTDTYVSNQAGVILARVYARAGRIEELAALDVIARLDILPTPELTLAQLYQLDVADLPEVYPPAPNAPIVGLIDSGIASGHPLIGPAVLAAEALSPDIPDGEDRHGHGTMVAGLLLHGSINSLVNRSLPTRPMCKLLSVAVLDENAQFPDERLWERDLMEALEWCASQGAKTVNLSVGDARRPFRGGRQHSAAALVDEAARRLGLVVVVASGNSHPSDYLGTIDSDSLSQYPTALLLDDGTGLLDPATSALALTVGGVTDAGATGGYSGHETVTRRPFGRRGWPSPVTRRGAGLAAPSSRNWLNVRGLLVGKAGP